MPTPMLLEVPPNATPGDALKAIRQFIVFCRTGNGGVSMTPGECALLMRFLDRRQQAAAEARTPVVAA